MEAVPAFCNRAVFLAEERNLENWDSQSPAEVAPTPGAFEPQIIQVLRNQKVLQAAAPA